MVKLKHHIAATCIVIISAAILFLGWQLCNAYEKVHISGHSMENTLHNGDMVFAKIVASGHKRFKKGEILVFHLFGNGPTLCKRCVAGAGDSILFDRSSLDTTLYSRLLYAPAKGDSLSFDESSFPCYSKAIAWETGKEPSFCKGYRFTHNWCYVLGDNRDHSVDSRHFGLVPEEFIIGVVIGRKYRKRVVPADCL